MTTTPTAASSPARMPEAHPSADELTRLPHDSTTNVLAPPEAGGHRAALREISRRLTAFQAGSEHVFLDVGRRLPGLAERAERLVAAGNVSAELERAGTSRGTEEELGEALARIEGHLTDSKDAGTAGLATLTALLEKTAAVIFAASAFGRVTMTLRALSTIMRVESHRSELGVSFDAVATDIADLARLIGVKLDALGEVAVALDEHARATQSRHEALLAQQETDARALLDDVRASLRKLASFAESAHALHAYSTDALGEISRAVTSIFVPIQAHDLTRQMIEHVVETLAALHATPATEPAAADVAHVCLVQAAQIRRASEQLVAAHNDIARALHLIASLLQELCTRTSNLAGERGPLERFEQSVAAVTRTLSQQLASERDSFAAVASVAERLEGMEGFVGEISAIAKDVKLVAFNASVGAAKMGTTGPVFAAIAHYVNELSGEISCTTDELAQKIQETTGVARSVGERLRARESVDDVERRMDRLTTSLRECHHGLAAGVAHLLVESSTIGREVADIEVAFEACARAAAGLGEIARALEDLARAAAPGAGGGAATSDTSAYLEYAAARYTTEVEREIHREITHETDDEPLPEVQPPDPTGLGANVELF